MTWLIKIGRYSAHTAHHTAYKQQLADDGFEARVGKKRNLQLLSRQIQIFIYFSELIQKKYFIVI